ncbi:MAG TPA: S8 family serine peptidase [Microthrixaceae bacterium]|nr:S8 family serine peptidase [Microthrixaceae bacterium]
MNPFIGRKALVGLVSVVATAVLVVDLVVGGVASAQTASAPGDAASGVVAITVTADGALDPAAVAAATGGTGRITATIDAIGATTVEVPAGRALDAVRRLGAVPEVDTAQADQQVRAFERVPTDPYWPQQEPAMRGIGAPAAWGVSTGAPSVVIAVVDSGVNPVSDLAGRVLPGYDFVNGDSDASDDADHGTESALVAAAAGDAGGGTAGMCWSCQVLPVKVLDREGVGSMFDVAAGIVWAADHGADVINLSLGGRFSDSAVTDALTYAYARDVVVVASAGNDGKSEKSYPAAEPGVISVGGIVNGQRNLHPLSRRGPTWVDVAAPWCNWVVMGSPDYFCGTSSSAPLVTGTAALLRTIRPAADRQMIATALLTTADHAPTTGLVGYGILDAGRAAAAVSTVAPGPTPNPPDVTPPTATMTAPGGYQIGSTVVQVVSDDDQGIVMVEVRLDGTLVAALANPARVQDLRFDTGFAGDGPHVVEAVVTDVGGHRVLAGSATMVTDNANPLGLLVSPSAGAKVSGSYVARVFVTDPNGIMGTFFIANDQVVGGFLGAGFGQVTVPVTRNGPIRVVALTVDNAGHISGTNTAVVTGSVPRRKARR